MTRQYLVELLRSRVSHFYVGCQAVPTHWIYFITFDILKLFNPKIHFDCFYSKFNLVYIWFLECFFRWVMRFDLERNIFIHSTHWKVFSKWTSLWILRFCSDLNFFKQMSHGRVASRWVFSWLRNSHKVAYFFEQIEQTLVFSPCFFLCKER